jgi:(2R)-3-sulfolactate dehydrogenase (NADP+)
MDRSILSSTSQKAARASGCKVRIRSRRSTVAYLAVAAARENDTATLAVARTPAHRSGFHRANRSCRTVGIGFTNASPVVAPPQRYVAVIGTNRFQCPADGGMHWDFSTQQWLLGKKITMAKAAGEKIPLVAGLWTQMEPDRPTAALARRAGQFGGTRAGWGFGLMAGSAGSRYDRIGNSFGRQAEDANGKPR